MKKFSAKNSILQNFETNINFALLEYHCLHLTISLTAKKFIQQMFGGTKTLSVSKITSKRMTLPLTNLLSTRGHDMSLSSTPGEVQSRFQEISQEVQNNQGKASISVTWGIKRQISTKGYVQSNISRQCHKYSLLGAVTNLPKILLIG